jgi:hypothetical protein
MKMRLLAWKMYLNLFHLRDSGWNNSTGANMRTNAKSVDPISESHESDPKVPPRSRLMNGIQGMIDGLLWSVFVAFVLNALSMAGMVFANNKFRFSMEEFLITFMIVPVWVVISGFIGLVRGAEKRVVPSTVNGSSLLKHLLVGGVVGIIPGLFVIPFQKGCTILDLVQALSAMALFGALIGFMAFKVNRIKSR